MNFFDAVLQAVNALVQQNLGIFDRMGQNLVRAFATILVVWYGIKAALAAGEHLGVVPTAVCILLGPVVIPFFIVPQLDLVIWGWLKAFIQYSFYQVVAAGVLYVVSQFTFGVIHAQITGLISPTDLIRSAPVMVVMYLAAIYAIIKVPMLTSHIFSGTSGGSAANLFDTVFRALGAAL